jgi:hypothetical protein
MARENFVICNRCGARVQPPQNSGWVVLLVVAPDGMNLADSLGDLCGDCRVDLMRFVNTSPKKVQLQ